MQQPFRKLLLSAGLGNLSDGLFLVALPLYVATLTRDPAAIAGMVFAATLPWLVFSPLAGVLIDRYDRKRIMVRVNAARCLLLAGLTLSLALNVVGIGWLYLVAFLMGVAEVLFDTASATILPAVVPKSDLERANNRLLATQLVTNDFLGKPIGGLLFSVAPWLPFLTQLLAQGTAAKTVQALPGTYQPAPRPGADSSLWFSVVEGFKWLLGHPTLRTLSILSVVRNIVEAGASAILVLYALEVLKLNEAAYGVLLASAAVGAVLATLVTERVLQRFGSGNTLVASIVLAGVSYGVIGLVPNVFVVGSMLALFAVTEVVWGGRFDLIPASRDA